MSGPNDTAYVHAFHYLSWMAPIALSSDRAHPASGYPWANSCLIVHQVIRHPAWIDPLPSTYEDGQGGMLPRELHLSRINPMPNSIL
jgi:hypothetical protein